MKTLKNKRSESNCKYQPSTNKLTWMQTDFNRNPKTKYESYNIYLGRDHSLWHAKQVIVGLHYTLHID